MIYLRMRETVERGPHEDVCVRDLCDVLCDARVEVQDLPVSVPEGNGVYCVQRYPGEQVSLLGSTTALLTRKREGRPRLLFLRAALAFLVLLAGSALAIMWFHADVNMYDAQREMYRAVTGGEEPAALAVALPYALGVG